MRSIRGFGLFLGLVLLATSGCHNPWRRQPDEDELPIRGSGLKGTSANQSSSMLGGDPADKTTSNSFFNTDRRFGGLSPEAQAIERNLGAY